MTSPLINITIEIDADTHRSIESGTPTSFGYLPASNDPELIPTLDSRVDLISSIGTLRATIVDIATAEFNHYLITVRK